MQLRTATITLLLLLAGLGTTPAVAQRAPDMATLDRGDGITKLGLDLGYIGLDGPPYDGAMRVELHGQYVTDLALGLYGALPLSLSFGDDDDPPGDQDDVALGGAELGLLYIVQSPNLSWIFRGGLVMPTADNSRDGALTNAVAIWPRFTDLARAVPDAWYLRPSASLLFHDSRLFLRGDLGLDLGLDDNNPEFLRLNFAGGVDLGAVALALELVNLVEIDDNDDDEDFLHTLAVSVRFMTERFEPFIAIGAPIDDSARGFVDFFVAGGLQFPL